MIKPLMLSTKDNPYNPFTNFDEWFAFDTQKGYNTCNYLARLARTSPDLSDEEETRAINDAITRIVLANGDLYIPVVEPEGLNNRQGEGVYK